MSNILGAFRKATFFQLGDMLKRSIPEGLNFAATGLPYWDTDIAGFFHAAAFEGLSLPHMALFRLPGPDGVRPAFLPSARA